MTADEQRLITDDHVLLDGWEWKCLRDVCLLRSEITLPSNAASLHYVGLEHIDSGNSLLGRWGSSTDVNSNKARFYRNDVLYGKLRPYLDKAVLASFDGICSTDILVLQSKPHLDPEFLVFLVHSSSFTKYAIKTTGGVNLPRTSWLAMQTFEFALPPLAEQRAIAATLRAVQAAREARQREVALERERKAALMQQLFTQGTRGEPTKTTEAGEVPESWDVVELENFAQVAYGLTVNQSRRSGDQTAPYLTVANVTRGYLRLNEIKEIGIQGNDIERYRLKKGDVLLIEGNGNPSLLGSAAIWNDELPFVLHQNHLIRVRSNSTVVIASWLMNYINSDTGRAQLLGKAKTSSGLHSINSRLIASLQIPLPHLPEQRIIAEVLRACDEKIAALEREVVAHDELFKALLEELMTGRRRVDLEPSPLYINLGEYHG